jgi:hypothetical protein
MGTSIQVLEWDGTADRPMTLLRQLNALQKQLTNEFGQTAKVSQKASGEIVATLQNKVSPAIAAAEKRFAMLTKEASKSLTVLSKSDVTKDFAMRFGDVKERVQGATGPITRLGRQVKDSEGQLDKTSKTSKRLNLAMQQLAFGAQDAAAVWGVTGLGGAVRAANNNLQQAIALMGVGGVAGVAFQLGTIALPVLADMFWISGKNAKEATDRMEEGFKKARDRLQDLERMNRQSRIGDDAAKEAEAREESAKAIEQIEAKAGKIAIKIRELQVEAQGDPSAELGRTTAKGFFQNIPLVGRFFGRDTGEVDQEIRNLELQQRALGRDRDRVVQQERQRRQNAATSAEAEKTKQAFSNVSQFASKRAKALLEQGMSPDEVIASVTSEVVPMIGGSPENIAKNVREVVDRQQGKAMADRAEFVDASRAELFKRAGRTASEDFQERREELAFRTSEFASRRQAAIARREGRPLPPRQRRQFAEEQAGLRGEQAELQLAESQKQTELFRELIKLQKEARETRPPNRDGNL